MAGDEARPLDQVGGADRARAEAQMRDGDRAGLLRVVDEVALRVQAGLLGDDLDRVLVRADGPVRAEAVEDGADDVVRLGRERGDVEAGAGDVVVDADREVRARLRLIELGERGSRHCRRELLRGEPVAAADHRQRPPLLGESGDDVLIERLAGSGRILAAVEDRHGAHRLRDRSHQVAGRERTVEPDLDQADLLAAGIQRLDRLLSGTAPRAHQHEHPLGVRSADVVEQPVAAAGDLGEPLHCVGDDRRRRGVVRTRRFTRLEEHIGVLGRAAQHGPVRRQRPRPVSLDHALVDERADLVVAQQLDHVQLVRGAEAVEEVEEGDA